MLIFDNADVILTADREALYGRLVGVLAKALPDIRAAFEPAWADFVAGRIHEKDFWARGLSSMGCTANLDQLGDIARAAFQPLPDAFEFLEDLRLRNVRTVRAANEGKDWDMYMRIKYDLPHYFKILVSSWQAGALMPDPKFFDALLAQLHVPAAECLFISATPAHLEGAGRHGFQTIRFQTWEQLSKALEGRRV